MGHVERHKSARSVATHELTTFPTLLATEADHNRLIIFGSRHSELLRTPTPERTGHPDNLKRALVIGFGKNITRMCACLDVLCLCDCVSVCVRVIYRCRFFFDRLRNYRNYRIGGDAETENRNEQKRCHTRRTSAWSQPPLSGHPPLQTPHDAVALYAGHAPRVKNEGGIPVDP